MNACVVQASGAMVGTNISTRRRMNNMPSVARLRVQPSPAAPAAAAEESADNAPTVVTIPAPPVQSAAMAKAEPDPAPQRAIKQEGGDTDFSLADSDQAPKRGQVKKDDTP